MLKNVIFCGVVILVVFKVFLVVKNLEILIQIVPKRSINYYLEQLVKNLYENKQITKQVYNNLIKAVTYKNDS